MNGSNWDFWVVDIEKVSCFEAQCSLTSNTTGVGYLLVFVLH